MGKRSEARKAASATRPNTDRRVDLMGLLEGKVAVITGAGSGIARAATMVFVREGAKVVAADVSGAERNTATEVGPRVLPFHCDVTKESDVAAMITAAVSEFGRVDAMLNVAGTVGSRQLPEVTMAEYDHLMDVNLRGVLLGQQYAVRAMLQSGGGAIVNFSSVGGLNAEAMASSAYMAAKAGVHAITKAAAVQYGQRGIRANVIAPGFTLTETMSGIAPEKLSEMCAKSALNRAGQPHEAAELAAFLVSDRASYITGVVIPVDGGWSAKLA
ncbi:MAG: SDR family NAD(P)-dependent oxidoreductase [Streptosporangiaceae bacterium]